MLAATAALSAFDLGQSPAAEIAANVSHRAFVSNGLSEIAPPRNQALKSSRPQSARPAVNEPASMGAGTQTTAANLRDAAMKERGPGPIWAGWWFWEPPPGKVKEDRPPQRMSPAEIPTEASIRFCAGRSKRPGTR